METSSGFAGLTVVTFLVAFGLTGLGFMIAWPMESTQGFHAIMNLFLIPMWLMSEALFPAVGAPVWLRWIMRLNPATYGVAAVRAMFYPDVRAVTGGSPPSLFLSLTIVILFAALTLVVSTAMTSRASGASR